MIISVPSSWNLSHSSLVSRLHEIFAISSLGMPGLVGMSGSVHTAGALPLKSPCPSREDRSARDCWLHDDFSTNCSSVLCKQRKKETDRRVRGILIVSSASIIFIINCINAGYYDQFKVSWVVENKREEHFSFIFNKSIKKSGLIFTISLKLQLDKIYSVFNMVA